jgi:hypothetical protein
MMRRISLVVTTVVATVLLTAPVALAQATTTTLVGENIINVSFTNPCTEGEVIRFEDDGTQFVLHSTTDANGGTHVHLISHNELTGVGESGTEYRLTSIGNNRFHNFFSQTPPYSFTFSNTFLVNAEGSADNFELRRLTHFTVNANGEVTAEVISSETRCLG